MKKVTVVRLALFCSLVLIFSSGCGSNQSSTQKGYSDDGYMGNSSANPGILTSPNSRTYGNDTDTIHTALKKIPNIRKSRVHYRGGTAVIRLVLEPGLSPEEVEAVRGDAQQIVAYSIPRYRVIVKVSQ